MLSKLVEIDREIYRDGQRNTQKIYRDGQRNRQKIYIDGQINSTDRKHKEMDR